MAALFVEGSVGGSTSLYIFPISLIYCIAKCEIVIQEGVPGTCLHKVFAEKIRDPK